MASCLRLTNEVVFSVASGRCVLNLDIVGLHQTLFSLGERPCFENAWSLVAIVSSSRWLRIKAVLDAIFGSKNGTRNWSIIECIDESTSEWIRERFVSPLELHLGSIWLPLGLI